MNFLKSSWSFLSSSFSQAEEDVEGDNECEAPSSGVAESVTDEQRCNSLESSDDLVEFTDAVDSTDMAELEVSDARTADCDDDNSQESEPSLSLAIGKPPAPFNADSNQDQSSSVDIDNQMDQSVKNQEVLGAVSPELEKGYTSLEASDSDDSGEFIPPPAAPVGPAVNTASQLNEIITNLGGDLGILSLEEENPWEATLPGDATVGNTFYTTAYDQTICPSICPDETLDDNTLGVTVLETDQCEENSSFDSAIASSSKSSNESGDSVKLNLNSKSDVIGHISPEAQPKTAEKIKELSVNLEPTLKENSIENLEDESVALADPSLSKEGPSQKSEVVSEITDGSGKLDFGDAPSEELKVIAVSQTAGDKLSEKPVDAPLHVPVDNTRPKMDDNSDEIPISRGSYSIDFDNLDNFNPFQCNKALMNSPEKPAKTFAASIENTANQNHTSAIQKLPSNEDVAVANNHSENNSIINLEEKVLSPETENVANSLIDVPTDAFAGGDNGSMSVVTKGVVINDPTANLENVDPLPAKPVKKVIKKPLGKKVNRPAKKKPLSAVSTIVSDPPAEEQDVIVPRGSYTIDFDNLDDFDPFKSAKAVCNSPTKPHADVTLTNAKSDISGAGDALMDMQQGPDAVAIDSVDNDVFKDQKPTGNDELQDSSTAASEEKVDAVEEFQNANELGMEVDHLALADTVEVSETSAEETPLPKGTYNLDFDNLDSMDPFKTSKGLANSPTKELSSGYTADLDNIKSVDPFKPSKAMANSPPASPVITPKNLPESEKDVAAANEQEKEIEPAVENKPDIPDIKTTKKTAAKMKKKLKAGIHQKNAALKPPEELEANGGDEIPPPKGSYSLDFDNLDSLDPFKTSKGLSNSPTSEAPMAAKSGYTLNFGDLKSVDPFKPSKAMPNSPPLSPSKDKPNALQEPEKTDVLLDVPATKKILKSGVAKKKIKPATKKPSAEVVPDEGQEIPVPRGAYNLDFENLDAMDPFKSSKGLSNSPTKEVSSGYPVNLDNLESVDPFKPSKAMANSPPTSPTKTGPLVDDDCAEPNTVAQSAKEASVKGKPPKKQSQLARKKLLKPKAGKPRVDPEPPNEDETPVPKVGYNLDFDNLDAMDPFKSSKGLSNSPTKEHSPPTTSACSVNLDNLDSIDPFKPTKTMPKSPPVSPTKIQPDSITVPADVDKDSNGVLIPVADSTQPTPSYKQLQQMEFERLNETEEFYPASSVFQDGSSLDFLDSLSTQPLTKSELRKQSLYVKFDPLVSDSPLKQVTSETSEATVDSVSAVKISVGKKPEEDKDVAAALTEDVHVQQSFNDISQSEDKIEIASDVSLGQQMAMDSFSQPYLSQQSYQPMSPALKYTQADLDAMLKKAEMDWKNERKEIKSKEEALAAELEQMNQVVKEYEQLFNAISTSENGSLTREQQLAKAEHEQSLEDMAALERSHEDLSRRYNRLKSVVAQFKQNEDILKKTATEMMEEAKATKEKYITLKVKADEEISKANKELQQVKANAQQEVARAQAQLKMLELKCESLQSQIRDCNTENEELTKLCDELIACSKQAQG